MSAPARSSEGQLLAYAQDLGGAYELLQAHGELLPAPLDPADLRQETLRSATITVLVASFPALPGMFEERTSLEPVLRTLNEHLTVVVDQVQAYQGVVERFTSGSLVATFGARQELPNANELALAAAMAVVGANDRFNREMSSGHWLDVGLGLATGLAVVGHLGAPHRWQMGVLGDCVNIAAQLAAKAQPLEVLLDENVYREVADLVRARYAGPTSLRGRRSNVGTYSIKPVE